MNFVTDANIIARANQPGNEDQAAAIQSLAMLRTAGDRPCIVPQNLYELWAVATRPAVNNGFGLTPAAAAVWMAQIRADFHLLPNNDRILPEWLRLVTTHDVSGKPAHDARYVAAMTVHSVTHILTFNDADFRRYPGITVLTPAAVISAGP